jgi:hypothetical protein
MLLLLGGPPRCGKTTLAERAAGERGIGWLSTDTVRDVVNLHIPLFEPLGIGAPHGPEADRFYRSFEKTAHSCSYNADTYLIEGVGFYPRHVMALRRAHGVECRAVFVGMRAVDLEAVLEHAGRNRWHEHLDEADVARIPAWIESWSAEIEAECSALGFDYVDVSGDFDAAMVEVERALFVT